MVGASRSLSFAASAAFVALLVLPASSPAGTIGFTIKSTVDPRDGLQLQLELRNTGDEAAHDVRPTAVYDEARATGNSERSIAPGDTRTWTIPLQKASPPPGSHVVVVRVAYEDANGYPFEVIATAPFAVNAAARAPVRGQFAIPPVKQNSAAQATLTLNMPKDRGQRFEVRLVLPGGLSTTPEVRRVDADAQRRVRVPVELKNVTLLPGTAVNVFALVTGLDEETPQTDVVQGTARVVAATRVVQEHTFTAIAVALAVYLVALEILSGMRRRAETGETDGGWAAVAEWALVLGPSAFLLYNYPWDALLADTVTAGGDMASLYYPTKLMAEEILPSWQLTGWTMGNYAGFPVFHFYSTLPFAFIVALGNFVPMTIAFKLVTLAGPTLLPVGAAYLFRSLGYGRGAAVLAAASTLPFLMQQGNSMWGGNIPSVLAGEFCHSIGITLSLFFLGVLHRTVEGRGSWPVAALLFAAIGLSHTFAFFAAAWYSLFYLWPRRDVARTAPPVLAIYAVTFLLLCFWGLPLPSRLVFTSEWSMIWRIKDWKEVLPEPLWPAAGLAVAGLLLGAVRLKEFRLERQGLLLFNFAGGIVLYFLVPALGFPDIRFIPIAQLFLGLLAADFVWWVLSGLTRHRLAASTVALAVVLAWSEEHLGYIPSWLKWNYSGYEGKNTWMQFKEINDHLRGDLNDSRVVFEHSQVHNRFGSSRAFENLPLFSGRSTLEGVFHQASQNSPFIFFLQSEASERGSGPFPQYTYTRLNPAKALPHFRMYNVGHVITVSDKAKEAYSQHPSYRKTLSTGSYAVFEIEGGDTGYAVLADNEPVLYDGHDWKLAFYRWFKHHDLIDVPLVPAEMISASDRRDFVLRTDAVERLPRRPLTKENCNIRSRLEQYRITLDTDCPGRPHIVKVSYFPRWRTADGSRLFPVSPGFMLVYPKSEHLEIEYRRTLLDWTGVALSLLGATLLVSVLARRSLADFAVARIRTGLDPALRFTTRHAVTLSLVCGLVVFTGAAATRLALRSPDRGYEEATEAFKARDFATAARLYEEWTREDRDTFKQATALYQLGVSHSELKNRAAAIATHERLRFQFPNVDYGAGTLFHLARNYAELGSKEEARRYATQLEREHPDTSWVKRLRVENSDLFVTASAG